MTSGILDLPASNADLDRRLFELESLLKAGEALHAELDVSTLCHLLLTMVRERVHVPHLAVLLHRPDAHRVTVERVAGLPDDLLGQGFPDDPGILWSLIRAGEPFTVADLDGRPRFASMFERHGLAALRSQLWVPLVMPGAVVGVLTVGGSPIRGGDHQFLQRLASRAALAIHTALLYRSIQVARKELDRSLHQLSLLFDVTRALSAVQNLTKLLRLILERAIEAVDAEKGSLMLFDEARDDLAIRVVIGLPDADLERRINSGEVACRRFKAGEGIAGRVFLERRVIRVDDAGESPDFTEREGSHVRSLLCVPLVTDDEAIGVINITNKRDRGSFAREDEEILSALADQAAVAIARARLYETAITDGLSGLFVRRYTVDRLRHEIKRARRYGQALSLVMCDIDHFKAINDGWGHPAGDAVIAAVARTLREGLRAGVDIAGRYGGEEFMILLPETDCAGAVVAGDRLRASVEALEIAAGDTTLRCTISVGVAVLDATDDDATLLQRADAALYAAKRGGRNRVTAAPAP